MATRAATGARSGAAVLEIFGGRGARQVLYQALVLGAIGGLLFYLVSNTLDNLSSRSIATGFDFLGREAGFPIAEHTIEYEPSSSYGRAYLVGILNTLLVSTIGIALATVLGVLIGVARLSSNWLVARLAGAYVELLRNIPLILQLVLWYGLFLSLPPPRQAIISLEGDLMVSNRGLNFSLPAFETVHGWALILVALGIVAWIGVAAFVRRHRSQTGKGLPVFLPGLVLAFLPGLCLFLAAGAPISLQRPELQGFNIAGGGRLGSEFLVLVFGLSTYTAAYIAEVVRAGILAVPRGQSEAALALGLGRGRALRFVLLPQALRLIVPPTTNQYLNLVKNSSLAVGIGYQELVSIGNTTINQTGQAIEGVLMIMAVYLTISLAISTAMNWYNRAIALKGTRR